jgi:predicted transcriptional regulator
MKRHTGKTTPRVKTLSIKIPAALNARVSKLAKARGSTVSEVVREALGQYAPRERLPFKPTRAT